MSQSSQNLSFPTESSPSAESERRTWLIACGAAGGVAAVATAVPLVTSMMPAERARSAGAPVEVDIGDIPPGGMKTVEWRGKPVWIVRRTPEMLASLEKIEGQLADPKSDRTAFPTPEYAKNRHRSIKPEYLITVGICTHLGCSPVSKFETGNQPGLGADWQGGYFCPCHGSNFDHAGRVYANKPAPDNLEIPRHMYLSDTRIVVGKDEKGEA
ncbi:MAG: ubiquinol-cytochrome c reductase iron-sulfur subunit [Burkholderiaceae bacterium]|nr:ubiquinol-cytochrome c reductase iron-sulfur subunit [Burkholderiaceae bacterium]